MIYIAYLSTLALCIIWTREVYIIIKNMINKNYLYDKWQHSLQHIIIIVLILITWLTMIITCTAEHKIPVIAYNLLMLLFVLPHFFAERSNEDI
jgi:hypothetical protein